MDCITTNKSSLATAKTATVHKKYSQSVFYRALAAENELNLPAVLCFMDAMTDLANNNKNGKNDNNGDKENSEDDEEVVRLLTEIYRLKAIAAESSITLFTQPSPSPFDTLGLWDDSSSSWSDLYSRCLMTVLHMIGCDSEPDRRFELIEHLRKAFRVESTKEHMRLFEQARNAVRPELRLNIAINEAKNLPESNEDYTNYFCAIHLVTKDEQILNNNERTESVASINNNFSWKPPSIFNLGLGHFDSNEVKLRIEFWKRRERFIEENVHLSTSSLNKGFNESNNDLSQNESKKKLKKRFKVPDLLSGRSSDLSSVRRTKKLLGNVEVDVGQIPASGINQWWPINHGKKINGQLRFSVHLSYSSSSSLSSLMEHRRLLRLLLAYELLKRNSPPFSWRDHFSEDTLAILAQHAVQNGLNREQTAKARFIVYAQIHEILPLDLRAFTPLLNRLRSSLSNSATMMDQTLMEASTRFATHSLITLIRQHRLLLASDEVKYGLQLEHGLRSLHLVHCINWRAKHDVVVGVEQTLSKANEEWIDFIVNRMHDIPENITDSGQDYNGLQRRVSSLTRLVRLISLDLETVARLGLSSLFSDHLNIHYDQLYLKAVFACLNRQNMLKTTIDQAVLLMKQASKSLEQANLDGQKLRQWCETALSLFKLYVELKRLRSKKRQLSTNNSVNSTKTTNVTNNVIDGNNGNNASWSNLSTLFRSSVSLWLDLACWETRTRMERSIQLDALRDSATPLVVHSSSAVDVCASFVRLARLWTDVIDFEQINADESGNDTNFVFAARIVDDICRLSAVYADKIGHRINSSNNNDVNTNATTMLSTISTKNEVYITHLHCLVFNNMDRVLSCIGRIVLDLDIGRLINNVTNEHGPEAGEVCKKSVKTMVRNGVENVENLVIQSMEQVVQVELSSRISALIGECIRDSCFVPLLHFLDENLVFAKANLSPDNFQRLLSVLWSATTSSLSEYVKEGLERRLGSKYFVSLLSAFRALLSFFFGENAPQMDENEEIDAKTSNKEEMGKSQNLTRLLKLHASETCELIREYYELRYAHQMRVASDAPLGTIVIRAILMRNKGVLIVEVLNARHILNRSNQKMGQNDENTSNPADNTSTTTSNSSRRRGSEGVWVLTRSCYGTEAPFSSSSSKFSSTLRNKVDKLRFSTTTSLSRSSNWIKDSDICNPYVKIRLVPQSGVKNGKKSEFNGANEMCRTKVQQQTLFPLFDETFELNIDENQDLSKTFLQLVIKDKPMVGPGLFVGEAYLPLNRIFQREGGHVELKELPQLQLALSRPSSDLSDLVFAVETRATDAVGREFVRKERNKANLYYGQ